MWSLRMRQSCRLIIFSTQKKVRRYKLFAFKRVSYDLRI